MASRSSVFPIVTEIQITLYMGDTELKGNPQSNILAVQVSTARIPESCRMAKLAFRSHPVMWLGPYLNILKGF